LQLTGAIANVTGKDITSVATQIGRALDNPAAGLQALSRSGIPLSAELKAQVIELSKRGDVLGAQKALLDDLENRFLAIGEAAAKADPLQQFNVALTEFKTKVGGDFLPAAGIVLSTMEEVFSIFEQVPAPIRGTTEALLALTVAGVALGRIGGAINALPQIAKNTATTSNVPADAQAAASTTALSDAEKVQAESAAGATSATEALNGSLATLDANAAGATGQMSLFDESLAAVAARSGVADGQLSLFDSELAATSGALATTNEQLSLFDASALETTAATGELASGMVLLNGQAIELATTEELLAARTALLAKSEEEAAAGTPLLAGRLTGLLGPIAGAVIGTLAISAGIDSMAKKAPDVEKLAKAMEDLYKSGQVPPILQQQPNLGALKQGEVANTGTFGLPVIHQSVAIGEQVLGAFGIGHSESSIKANQDEVKAEDAALAQLVSSGNIQAASAWFNKYGVAIEEAGGKFPGFKQALQDWIDQQKTANTTAADATTVLAKYAQQFQDLQTQFDLTGGLDTVKKAQDQVKADYADIAGTSQKAKDADKAETDAKHQLADAYHSVGDAQLSLKDAYQGVTDAENQVTQATQAVIDSQHALMEAQQAYDDYNSSRGQQERALQADILNRRFVATPTEEDQKRLDILKQQDTNQQQQQQLADRLHSAQEGVTRATEQLQKAYLAIPKAQEQVAKAERGVEDATYRVQSAQDAVTNATQKRLAVSDDASKRIQTDVDAEQKALLQVVTKLQDAAAKGEIPPKQADEWVAKLENVAATMNGPVSKAVDNLFNKVVDLGGPLSSIASPTGSGFASGFNQLLQQAEAQAKQDPSKLTPYQRTVLHAAGIPGFSEGGLVPGLPGAPTLAIVHGGERVLTPQQQRQYGGGVTVQQTNHFNGNAPTEADLEYANTQLGWRLSRAGRY
jgi:hypothetical protein